MKKYVMTLMMLIYCWGFVPLQAEDDLWMHQGKAPRRLKEVPVSDKLNKRKNTKKSYGKVQPKKPKGVKKNQKVSQKVQREQGKKNKLFAGRQPKKNSTLRSYGGRASKSNLSTGKNTSNQAVANTQNGIQGIARALEAINTQLNTQLNPQHIVTDLKPLIETSALAPHVPELLSLTETDTLTNVTTAIPNASAAGTIGALAGMTPAQATGLVSGASQLVTLGSMTSDQATGIVSGAPVIVEVGTNLKGGDAAALHYALTGQGTSPSTAATNLYNVASGSGGGSSQFTPPVAAVLNDVGTNLKGGDAADLHYALTGQGTSPSTAATNLYNVASGSGGGSQFPQLVAEQLTNLGTTNGAYQEFNPLTPTTTTYAINMNTNPSGLYVTQGGVLDAFITGLTNVMTQTNSKTLRFSYNNGLTITVGN